MALYGHDDAIPPEGSFRGGPLQVIVTGDGPGRRGQAHGSRRLSTGAYEDVSPAELRQAVLGRTHVLDANAVQSLVTTGVISQDEARQYVSAAIQRLGSLSPDQRTQDDLFALRGYRQLQAEWRGQTAEFDSARADPGGYRAMGSPEDLRTGIVRVTTSSSWWQTGHRHATHHAPSHQLGAPNV